VDEQASCLLKLPSKLAPYSIKLARQGLRKSDSTARDCKLHANSQTGSSDRQIKLSALR